EPPGSLAASPPRGRAQARTPLGKALVGENNYKRAGGEGRALAAPAFMAAREAAEKELRARVAADPSAQGRFGAAWDDIDKATAGYVAFRSEMRYPEGSRQRAAPIHEGPRWVDSRLVVAEPGP